ncbi:MAG: hypothetical protein J0H57_05130, partial [Rhodospirillales bacterium]|nr:hypothetical protein [Rhodospirillales bacterium]
RRGRPRARLISEGRHRDAEIIRSLAATYRAGVTWEDPAALERRAAHLLPGLFLARVDGKSPVEYITAEQEKDRVRRTARALLLAPPDRLAAIRQAWSKELAA